jgi:hypothetical protein
MLARVSWSTWWAASNSAIWAPGASREAFSSDRSTASTAGCPVAVTSWEAGTTASSAGAAGAAYVCGAGDEGGAGDEDDARHEDDARREDTGAGRDAGQEGAGPGRHAGQEGAGPGRDAREEGRREEGRPELHDADGGVTP